MHHMHLFTPARRGGVGGSMMTAGVVFFIIAIVVTIAWNSQGTLTKIDGALTGKTSQKDSFVGIIMFVGAALFVFGLIVAIVSGLTRQAISVPVSTDIVATQQTAASVPAVVSAPISSAATSPVVLPQVAASPGGTDVATRLRTIENLKSQGLITDAEYQAKRQVILESLA